MGVLPKSLGPEYDDLLRCEKLQEELFGLLRFDAALLIAFTATKETDCRTETDGRIPPRCGADRTDQ